MTDKQELMVEFTVQDMVRYLMKDYDLDMDKALDVVYTSHTFKLLEDIETGLYLEESPYTYNLLKEEPGIIDRVKGD